MASFSRLGALAFAASALVAFALAPARAQDQARPSVEERRPPALLVQKEPGQASEPLRVSAASLQVTILGNIASTTLDLTFTNDTARVLEGELVLPLPPGATISSLALEFDGKLRQASVVEKEKARVVFEEVVRRGVDPGLVEWVKGNVFRTRVYPIPANGKKRVVLGWGEPLVPDATGKATYWLPLGWKGLDEVTTSVRRACANEVVLLQGDKHVTVPDARKAGAAPLVLPQSGPNVDAPDVRIEIAPSAESTVLVEPARVKPAVGSLPELAWVAQVLVPASPAARVIPKRVTILWDASGSAASRDHVKERAFLEAYLAQLGDAEARLVPFSNDVWGEEVFAIKGGKCPEILARIDAIRPDGGTRFQCLDLKKLEASCDAFLLFSDGFATFGEGDPAFGAKPVTAIASGPTLDLATVDRLARGGALVNLNQTSAADGVARALEPPLVFAGMKVEGEGAVSERTSGGPIHGARVDEVFPSVGARVSGATFTLAGRLSRGKPVTVTPVFARGGTLVPGAPFTLDPDSGTETGRVERIWASKKIESLMANSVANESEIVATAKAHGIVTPLTSLLVLDRLEDYVRYHVTPPAEMRDEWEKRIEEEKATAAKDRQSILEALRAKWQARVEWWKRDFKYPEGFKFADPEKGASGAGAAEGMSGSGGGEDRGIERERGAREERRLRAEPARPESAPAPPPPRPTESDRDGGGAPAPELGLPQSAPRGGVDSVMAKKTASPSDGEGPSSIQLKPWDPKTPYLEAIRAAKDTAARYGAYLDERAKYTDSTAFFLDCADAFFEAKEPVLALRILSNIAELKLESAPLSRILAYRLAQVGQIDLAIEVFQGVARLKPEEPQSWRDLGLAQAEAHRWKDAVANLEKVCVGKWDGRFPDIDLIALGELNEVLSRAKADTSERLTTLPDDLLAHLDGDVRVILTWDADACDMDLWVTEPSGEKAFYGHKDTTIGGKFGQDFTQGYGPEEYLLKKAMPGTYKIQINYYGNHQQIIAGATTVQVLVIKNYGRPNEERTAVTRRLKDDKETIDIADVVFGK